MYAIFANFFLPGVARYANLAYICPDKFTDIGMDKNTDITVQALADALRTSPDTLRKRIVRAGAKYPDVFADTSAGLDRVLSAEQVRILSGNPAKVPANPTVRKPRQVETKSEAIIHTPAPAGPGVFLPTARQAIKWPTLAQIRNTAISCILIGVVLCHAGLIWYDCSQLWDMAGQIGGGAVFLIVLAAVMLAADQSHYATSEAALWFIFLVDCAAWWVHMPVFKTPVVSDTITGSLCAFLCASSWMALYLFRAKNIE